MTSITTQALSLDGEALNYDERGFLIANDDDCSEYRLAGSTTDYATIEQLAVLRGSGNELLDLLAANGITEANGWRYEYQNTRQEVISDTTYNGEDYWGTEVLIHEDGREVHLLTYFTEDGEGSLIATSPTAVDMIRDAERVEINCRNLNTWTRDEMHGFIDITHAAAVQAWEAGRVYRFDVHGDDIQVDLRTVANATRESAEALDNLEDHHDVDADVLLDAESTKGFTNASAADAWTVIEPAPYLRERYLIEIIDTDAVTDAKLRDTIYYHPHYAVAVALDTPSVLDESIDTPRQFVRGRILTEARVIDIYKGARKVGKLSDIFTEAERTGTAPTSFEYDPNGVRFYDRSQEGREVEREYVNRLIEAWNARQNS